MDNFLRSWIGYVQLDVQVTQHAKLNGLFEDASLSFALCNVSLAHLINLLKNLYFLFAHILFSLVKFANFPVTCI